MIKTKKSPLISLDIPDDLPESPFIRGFTSDFYLCGNESILKLYRDWMDPSAPQSEAAALNAAFQAGIRVPQVKGLVEVKGRHGIILERIEGRNIRECLHAYPYRLIYYARLFAELLASINAIVAPSLQSQKKYLSDTLSSTNSLSMDLQQNLVKLLDHLPSGDRLCHGDFYYDHIIMTSSGPVIIDWEKSSRGDPASDLAISNLILSKTIQDKHTHALFRFMLLLFRHAYITRYRQISPQAVAHMDMWMPIMAGLKLLDNRSDQRKYLEKLIRDFYPTNIQPSDR
jgi:tRNA A-37 threonylcarbamoyl transferase component Bud32